LSQVGGVVGPARKRQGMGSEKEKLNERMTDLLIKEG
jgi:hypothetical protein